MKKMNRSFLLFTILDLDSYHKLKNQGEGKEMLSFPSPMNYKTTRSRQSILSAKDTFRK